MLNRSRGRINGDETADSTPARPPAQPPPPEDGPRRVTHDGHPVLPRARADRRVAILATALAVLPLVVAAVRALVDGWVPTGDDAFIALRARDAFEGPMPHLGTWTSASQWAGIDMNMPGPAMFDALALPVHLFGPVPGVVVGTALVNAAAVVACAAFAWRMGRLPLLLATNVFVISLLWSMGSSSLIDPWNPTFATLPFLALLMATAAACTGDPWALPVSAVAATFVVQAHLSFVLLGPGLFVLGASALALQRCRDHRLGRSSPWSTRVAGWCVAATALLGVVGWLRPLYEELTGDPGNLTRLYRASHAEPPPAPGFGQTLGATSLVVARPPLWLWRSWHDLPLDLFTPPPSAGPSGLLLVAVVGFLVAIGLTAYRRRDRPALGLASTATATLALAMASVSRSTSPFGLRPEYMRYLWPTALLTWLTIGYGLARSPWLRSRVRGGVSVRPAGTVLALAATVILAVLAMTPTDDTSTAKQWAAEPSRQLGRAADVALPDGSTVIVRFGDSMAAHTVGPPVMLALVEAGHDLRTESTPMAFQLGRPRRYDPARDGEVPLLVIATEPPTDVVGRAVRTLATTEGLDAQDRVRRKVLLERFVAGVRRDGGLRWSPAPPEGEEARQAIGHRSRRAPESVLEDRDVLRHQWPWLRPPSGMAQDELDELVNLSRLEDDRRLTLYLIEP